MFRWIKSLFHVYESGYEYWVYTKDIKVNPEWRLTKIRPVKFKRKMNYWLETGEFESKIILDRDFNLLDGYSSLRIAELEEIEKLPVWFVGGGKC